MASVSKSATEATEPTNASPGKLLKNILDIYGHILLSYPTELRDDLEMSHDEAMQWLGFEEKKAKLAVECGFYLEFAPKPVESAPKWVRIRYHGSFNIWISQSPSLTFHASGYRGHSPTSNGYLLLEDEHRAPKQ